MWKNHPKPQKPTPYASHQLGHTTAMEWSPIQEGRGRYKTLVTHTESALIEFKNSVQ